MRNFDLKSKKSINGEQKYYLSDLGFYFATNTDNRVNYGPALENVVFTYARSHCYAANGGHARQHCVLVTTTHIKEKRPCVKHRNPTDS